MFPVVKIVRENSHQSYVFAFGVNMFWNHIFFMVRAFVPGRVGEL